MRALKLRGLMMVSLIGIWQGANALAASDLSVDYAAHSVPPSQSGIGYTTATLRVDNHRKDDLTLDIESDYLPRILQAQVNDAGSLNPEALKALAIADRSVLYASLEENGYVLNGGLSAKYKASITPQQSVLDAVAATRTQYLYGQSTLFNYDGICQPVIQVGSRPASVSSAKQSAVENQFNVKAADLLADHGWNELDILHLDCGFGTQLTVGKTYRGTGIEIGGGSAGTLNLIGHGGGYTPPSYELVGLPTILSDFEQNAGYLQSAGTANNSSRYVIFDANTNASLSSIQPHSGKSSLELNINYNQKGAKGKAFDYRLLTGVSGEAGYSLGNIRLFDPVQIGFFARTTTPDLEVELQGIVPAESRQVDKTRPIRLSDDGAWHKYSWDIEPGDSAPYLLDSLYITGKSDATVNFDDLYFHDMEIAPVNPSSVGLSVSSESEELRAALLTDPLAPVLVPEPAAVSALILASVCVWRGGRESLRL